MSQLPPPVKALLTRYQARRAHIRSLSSLALALAAAIGLLLLSLTTDRLVELPTYLRALLPTLTLLIPSALLITALIRWIRRLPDDLASAELDAAYPDSRDILRSSLNFHQREDHAPGQIHPYMLTTTHQQSATTAASLHPASIISTAPIWKRLACAALLTLVLVGLAATPWLPWQLMWQRFTDPLGNHPRPSFTLIQHPAPLHTQLAQGDDLLIEASLAGTIPDAARATLVITRGGTQQALTMSPLPNHTFRTQLTAISEPFTYHITAGDGRTARHQVSVIPLPSLQQITVRYDYPRYTRLERLQEPLKFRELKGVPGTRVRLEFHASLPIQDSWVQFPNRRYRIQWDRQKRHGSFQFVIEDDTSFSIHLQATNGIQNRGETPFRVRALPDNPPTVTMSGIPAPPTLFLQDMLTLQYNASDDFGIAELFIRAYPGISPRPKFYSLQLDKSAMLKTAGSVSVKIAEFASETDAHLRIELVAVDTRGQETPTPRAEINLVSETPDRQLAELITIHKDYIDIWQRGRVKENAEALRTQLGKLTILIDGMDQQTKLEGQRLNMYNSLFAGLRKTGIRGQEPWVIWQSEFPYSSQRPAELLMPKSWVLRDHTDYARIHAAIPAADGPAYDHLQHFHTLLSDEAKLAQLLLKANRDILSQNRLRLISYLTEKTTLLLDPPPQPDAELLERQQQQRYELIQTLLAIFPDLYNTELDAIAQPLKDVAALQNPPIDQLRQALTQLTHALHHDGWLDGHLQTSAQTVRTQWDWPRLIIRAQQPHGRPDLVLRALHDTLRLRRDTPVGEDAELFLLSRLHAALTTHDPARIQAAIAAYKKHQHTAETHDLNERLRLLQLRLHQPRIDVAIGRRLPQHPSFERDWHEIRDLYWSITRETKAGRWAYLPDSARQQLLALSQHQPLFIPWTASTTWTAPTFNTQADALQADLTQLIATLAPTITASRPALLAEWPHLVQDIQTSIAREQTLLGTEVTHLRAEIDTSLEILRTNDDAKKQNKAWFGQYAKPERTHYARQLVFRMQGWIMALDQYLAIREAAWIDQPTTPTDHLQALSLLAAKLGTLDEELYDSTWAAHLNRPRGQYPHWLTPIANYMEQTQTSTLPHLTHWYQLTTSNPAHLTADPDFQQATAKLATAPQHTAYRKALATYSDFMAFTTSTPTAHARHQRLKALADSDLQSVYWDRIAIAIQHLHTTITPDQSFSGLSPSTITTANYHANYLLTTLGELQEGDITTSIHQLLSDWDYYAGKTTTTAVAALTPDQRQLLAEDLRDWLGRLEGTRRSLQDLLRVTPPLIRARRRLTDKQRYDLQQIAGRMVRNEARWTERVAEAQRWTLSLHSQWLAPIATPPDTQQIAWATGLTQRLSRRSASVIRRQNQGLGGDQEGPSSLYLKMPKHLYEELMRANAQPYPSQFKDPSLAYMRALIQESR